MKKLLYPSVVLVLVFAACSKSNNNPSGNIPPGVSAKINGTLVTFKGPPLVDTSNGTIDIAASIDSFGNYPTLNIYFESNGVLPFKPGVYVNSVLADPSAPYSELNYYVGAGGGSYNSVTYHSYDDTVTVTSITSKGMAGTFHGTVDNHYFDPISTQFKDSILTVTDGAFNVNF